MTGHQAAPRPRLSPTEVSPLDHLKGLISGLIVAPRLRDARQPRHPSRGTRPRVGLGRARLTRARQARRGSATPAAVLPQISFEGRVPATVGLNRLKGLRPPQVPKTVNAQLRQARFTLSKALKVGRRRQAEAPAVGLTRPLKKGAIDTVAGSTNQALERQGRQPKPRKVPCSIENARPLPVAEPVTQVVPTKIQVEALTPPRFPRLDRQPRRGTETAHRVAKKAPLLGRRKAELPYAFARPPSRGLAHEPLLEADHDGPPYIVIEIAKAAPPLIQGPANVSRHPHPELLRAVAQRHHPVRHQIAVPHQRQDLKAHPRTVGPRKGNTGQVLRADLPELRPAQAHLLPSAHLIPRRA